MSQTKVAAVICRKGGAGKTTVAVHLAVAAEKLGLVTAILDLDPQANTAMWGDRRGERGEASPAVISAQASRLPILIKQARDQEADLIIIDTPPHADTTATAAATHADLILIPVQPSGADLDALPATIQLARASGKPFFVVLNGAPVQGEEVAEVTEALTEQGVQLAPVVLHWRKAFKSRWQASQTAEEFDAAGKAAGEVRALMLWVSEQLGFTAASDSGRKSA
jgi:chromosome partitioning protein